MGGALRTEAAGAAAFHLALALAPALLTTVAAGAPLPTGTCQPAPGGFLVCPQESDKVTAALASPHL